MLRSRTAALLVAFVVVLAATGCTEPEVTPEAAGPEVVTVMVDLPDATPEQMNEAADVVRARVMALDLEVGEIGWDDASIEVIVAASDEELVRAALEPAGVIEFRPVLAAMGATATGTTPPAERSAEVQVTASDLDGGTYVLGPAAQAGGIIESAAAAEPPSGTWIIDLVLHDGADGIDAFNEIAGQCFAGAATCPAGGNGSGQVAIVLDDVVLSAPAINVASFERDQIQISGSFDETSGRALAATLDGGAANVAWTVRD